MTAAGILLREEIRKDGPIGFHRFMKVALHHYYRRGNDPFGAGGDFYTASQLQPVFGRLIAASIRALWKDAGEPADFQIVELGPGRGEMEAAFRDFPYTGVDFGRGELPERIRGIVFSNEFFDALPVHRIMRIGGVLKEMLVDWKDERFGWVAGPAFPLELPELEEGNTIEVNLEALEWLERIARSLESGYLFTIDYGYTRRELARFPSGTLMSYRRHVADEDVLRDPGERDITAHVCFTALQERGREFGLATVRFERLAQTLLSVGPAEMEAAIASDDPSEERRRRSQLKTLLFGMGETFRTLVQAVPK